MKPPYCYICGTFLEDSESGGLVHFARTEEDIEWAKRMKKENKVGHPPYMEWFCEKHYYIAKEYSHLPFIEAIKAIKNEIKERE